MTASPPSFSVPAPFLLALGSGGDTDLGMLRDPRPERLSSQTKHFLCLRPQVIDPYCKNTHTDPHDSPAQTDTHTQPHMQRAEVHTP